MNKLVLLVCYSLGAIIGAITFYVIATLGWGVMLDAAVFFYPEYAAQAAIKEQWWFSHSYDIFTTILLLFACMMAVIFFKRLRQERFGVDNVK